MSLPTPAPFLQGPPRRQRAASAGSPRTSAGCPRTPLQITLRSQASPRSTNKQSSDGLEFCDHAPRSLNDVPLRPPTTPRSTDPDTELAVSLRRSKSTGAGIQLLSSARASNWDLVKREPDCKVEADAPRAEKDFSKAPKDVEMARPVKTVTTGDKRESSCRTVPIKKERCSDSDEDSAAPSVTTWSVQSTAKVTKIEVEDDSGEERQQTGSLDWVQGIAVHRDADKTKIIQQEVNKTTTVHQENNKTTTVQQEVHKTITVHRDADETTTVRAAAIKTIIAHQDAEDTKTLAKKSTETSEEARNLGPSVVRWTEADTGSKALSKILPFNTIKRLIDDPGRCAASITRERSRRCMNVTKWSQVFNAKAFHCISELRDPVTRSDALKYIELLVNGALCTRGQHRRIASTALAKLRTCLDELSIASEKLTCQDDFTSADLAAFPAWVKALINAKLDVDQTSVISDSYRVDSKSMTKIQIKSDRYTKETRTSDVSRSGGSLLAYTNRQQRSIMMTDSVTTSSIQLFIPYRTKRTSKPVSDILRETLVRSLTSREVTDGLIYMYWYPGNFGYIKIGLTEKKTISERLAEWQRQCKHEAQPHWTSEMQSGDRVPHVYRVEALVHAELNDHRFQEEQCKGCGKNHIEWFRVTVEMAQRVIKKWSQWMIDKQPYGVGEKGSPLEKSIGKSEVQKLCQPLALEYDTSEKSPQGGQNNKSKQPPTQKSKSTRKKKETQSPEAIRKLKAAREESAVQEQEDALAPEVVAKEGAARKIKAVRKQAEIRRLEAAQKQRAARNQEAMRGRVDVPNRVAKRKLQDVNENTPCKVIIVNRPYLSVGSIRTTRSRRTGMGPIA